MALIKTLRGFQNLDEIEPLDDGTTRYYVLSKNADGTGYTEHSGHDTASAAWSKRKELSIIDPSRKYFLRKRREYVVGPGHVESGEAIDLWREAYRTGNDAMVPQDQWGSYQSWVAKKVSARQAYARFDGNQPRWN